MTETKTLLRARAQRLYSERARKLEQLRKAEWQFEKNLDATYAKLLRGLRDQISDLESQIVQTTAFAEAAALIEGDWDNTCLTH